MVILQTEKVCKSAKAQVYLEAECFIKSFFILFLAEPDYPHGCPSIQSDTARGKKNDLWTSGSLFLVLASSLGLVLQGYPYSVHMYMIDIIEGVGKETEHIVVTHSVGPKIVEYLAKNNEASPCFFQC